MRVLLTTDTVGGVWTFTCELATQLLLKGHGVALVSFGRGPSRHQQQWCADIAGRYGDRFLVRTSDAPLEWMQDNEHTLSFGKGLLLDVCDQFLPDMLHSSQFCWGALDVSVPIVVTAHSDVLSWAESCRPDGLEDSAWLRCYRRLVQEGLDGAAAVTAPTAWMAGALRRNFEVDGEIEVVANGRTVFLQEGDRKLQAVSAGRLWDEAKGLKALLDLQSPVPIVVAGETDGGIEASTSVTFAGTLSADELLQLFSDSSIYIAASIYEPFGLAPLEGALCGCAVVARDVPSLREVWGDAATYFRDVRDLESALQGFAADPELLQRKKAAALKRAKGFSSQKMAGRYLALYERLLAERHADPSGCEVTVHAS